MRSIILSIVFFATSYVQLCSAQFVDKTSILESHGIELTNPFHGFGSGISFYDFNQDGWDDLTMGGGASNPVFLINNEGTLEPIDLGITNPGGAWIQALLWVDYNNDGNPDLFISKYNGSIELWKNSGNLNFTNVAAEAGLNTGIYAHTNATFGDYNHDGCLDLYLSKYYLSDDQPEYAGTLYRNNCDGTFTDVTVSSGVYVPPHMALQPTFTDINNDGWEDLFIAVDRVSVPNELFLNNQDGTFTRITESAGVQDYIDAMSSTITDFNHNQLLDIFVTNNPMATGNILYRNNGDSTFTDIAVDMGINLMHECWGALWIDYNNNTWEDLFISRLSGQFTSVGNHFFTNNNGVSFTNTSESAGINAVPSNTFVVAKGDLNNDGYYDFANGNRDPFTHRLYQNMGGTNNYISVTLQGTLANRDGIGTWIHCYVGGDHLVNFVQCGENLSGQDSRKNIFGIGSSSEVDSLVLEWNSGTREVYLNPDINTHHFYVEGASFNEPFALQSNGSSSLCVGDSLVLTAGDYQSYLWNTGDTTQSIVVTEPGEYSVEVVNEFGLSVSSITEVVTVAPPSEVSFEVEHVSCTGASDGSIEASLSTGTPDSIAWSNGTAGTILENLSGGLYSFSGTDQFGCAVSGEAFVSEPSPLLATTTVYDVLCYGDSNGVVSATALGGTPPYSADWNGLDTNAAHAGDYSAVVSDTNGCEVELSFSIDQPDSLWVELNTSPATGGDNGTVSAQAFGGIPPYQIEWSIGESGSFELTDLPPGEYSLTVTDNNDCEFATHFTIDNTTGIHQHAETRLQIFPNPARDEVNLTGCRSGAELWLYDVYGQTVLHQLTYQCPTDIDVAHLRAGTYLLRVNEDSNHQSIRLVLIR